MKFTIKDGKGKETAFLYDLIDSGVYIVSDQTSIEKNIRAFGVKNNFDVTNCSFVKREQFAIVTLRQDGLFIQILVTPQSKVGEVMQELRYIAEEGFKLVGKVTVEEFKNIVESQNGVIYGGDS